jgi:prepilin-type N-terminal cleavage/methylation domain-containing protein
MKKRGFTLIELIAVIAILAILGFVLVPRIGGYQARARKSQLQHSARNIIHAVQTYNADKKDRSSVDIVATERVVDSDKVEDIIVSAINSEIQQEIIRVSGYAYETLKDLTLSQLIGVSNSNFTLNSDGSINVASIIEGSINDL